MRKLLLVLATFILPIAAPAQDNITAKRPFGQRTVAFSATPTFDAGVSDSFKITLTGNVTSSTLIGAEAGTTLKFEVCQDAVGARTFVWPSQMVGQIAILAGANVCTVEFFHFDGTSAIDPTTATGGGGGAGTVAAGTTGQIAYYGANGTTASGNTKLDEGFTTANTLTYSGAGGVSAATFNATGTGSMSLIGTNGTCSGAAVGKTVLCLGDLTSNSGQISENGASFFPIPQWTSSSPVVGGVVVAQTFPQHNSIARGTQGQPFLEGSGAGNPGWGPLDISSALNVMNRLQKANALTTAVYTDQVNTAGTAMTLDMSGATGVAALRAPNLAGAAPTGNGVISYDTTSNMVHFGVNGADSRAVITTIAPTDTFCAQWTRTAGHYELGQASATCATPGSSPPLNNIIAATAAGASNHGDFDQIWRASLTTAGKHWFTITENSASVATGTPYLFDVHSIASSTANPFIVTALGTANGWNLLNGANPLFAPVGTGALAIPGSAKGVVVSQGPSAAATTVTGTVNQLVTFDGSGNPIAADPIISYNYVPIWTVQDVTVTRTSAAVRNPIFSQTGTLQLTWASITGSPATCTLQIQGVDSVGNALNNGSTFNVSPANGTTSQTFTAAASLQSAAQIKTIFACGTYPTTGTLTLDFTPIPNVNVTNTVAISAASLPLPTGASTSAKQPALGTAGTPSADVITVQGAASMTKLLVTPDSVALPANQSVNVSQINAVTPLMGNGVTGTGSPRVTIASDNTAFSVNATLSAETTKVIGAVRSLGNSGASVDGATGAAPPANVIFVGGLKSGATGGFLTGISACDLDFNINISTATTTLAVTGVSGRQVRICSLHLMNNAADNVAFIEGTGATCGTGTAGMAGGTTAASGYNFSANGGLTLGGGLGEVMTTATAGDSVCIVTSAATQLSGHIKYTIY